MHPATLCTPFGHREVHKPTDDDDEEEEEEEEGKHQNVIDHNLTI